MKLTKPMCLGDFLEWMKSHKQKPKGSFAIHSDSGTWLCRWIEPDVGWFSAGDKEFLLQSFTLINVYFSALEPNHT